MSYRSKARKGRADLGKFTPLPHRFFKTAEFGALSPGAVKLLLNIYMQYNGNNNGDFTVAWSVMRKTGWTSKSLLQKALNELIARGWVLRTRQGGRRSASLYAVTFIGIDECAGKLDAGVKASGTPLHLWEMPQFANTDAVERSKRRVNHTRASTREAGHDALTLGPNVVRLKAY